MCTVYIWFWPTLPIYGYVQCKCGCIRCKHDVNTVIYDVFVGLARTINIRCIYGIFGREITKYTVIYGVYMRFWPTLCIYDVNTVNGFGYLIYNQAMGAIHLAP